MHMKFYLAAPILLLSLAGCHEGSPSSTDQTSFIGFNKGSSIEEVKKTINDDLGLNKECETNSNNECVIIVEDVDKGLKKDTLKSQKHKYYFSFYDNNIMEISATYYYQTNDAHKYNNESLKKYLKNNGFDCKIDSNDQNQFEKLNNVDCNDQSTKLIIIHSNPLELTLTMQFNGKKN